MRTPKSSPAFRALKRLSDAVYLYRAWFFWPQVALVVLCVWYTVTHLQFLTERSALVGGDKEYHRIYQELRKEFPAEDDLVAVVESEQLEKNRQFVERLGAKLEAARISVVVHRNRDRGKRGGRKLPALMEPYFSRWRE